MQKPKQAKHVCLQSESHQMAYKSDLGFAGCDVITEKPSLHAFFPLHHQTQNTSKNYETTTNKENKNMKHNIMTQLKHKLKRWKHNNTTTAQMKHQAFIKKRA